MPGTGGQAAAASRAIVAATSEAGEGQTAWPNLMGRLANWAAARAPPCKVLPLNQICAGTLRALRLMMSDHQEAADVAAAAAAWSGGPLDAAGGGVAVRLGSAGSEAAPGKLPPPAVVTVQRGSGGGQAWQDGQASGWMRGGDVVADDSARSPLELSGPSGLPTPSTARPLSPDPLDAFAT